LIDPRTKDIAGLTRQLEENGGILGDSGIPIVTNLEKYPNEIKNLPYKILLSNGDIMNIRTTKTNIISLTGDLDHFGIRVLAEPFQTEEELSLEQILPDKYVLKDRIKRIFPHSDFNDKFC
jgi:hypothetical protein